MKDPIEIAAEVVRYDWNTGSAAFHTDRVMLQTYVFGVPCRMIPGATAEAAVAKFETWAEPIRARVAAVIAAAIVAEVKEAEVRGATRMLEAAKAAHNSAKGACESRDCCEGITTIALRSLDPAAIVAERGAGTPHFCEIHRATSGEHDCGLEPCEEATIHKDLGPPRRAKVRRNCIEPKPTETLDPNPAEGSKVGGSAGVPPAPACARCGGSGKIVVHECQCLNESGNFEWHVQRDPCPACGGKP